MAPALSETAKEVRDSAVPRVSVNSLASTLRRTTCDVCRERKVRCDRTKPECLRCRRFGSICTYPSPEADAARLQETLHNLSKRLEDAESRLQSHQPLVHNLTPVLASEDPILNFSTVDLPAPGSSADACEDTDFHPWYWDQPIAESLLPDGMLFHGIPTPAETAGASVTEFSSLAGSLGREIGNQSINQYMAVEQSSPADNGFGIYPISAETCAGLYEAYFHIVQKHLPLINKDNFFLALTRSPEKHQMLALKYAVCMAGAQVESIALQIKEQYYVAARYHLEQAELGTGGSSFWSIEAAQALVLVARFEFGHFNSPRATITMSRLFSLMSALGHSEDVGLLKEQDVYEEELNRRKIISQINASFKLQEICLAGNTYPKPLAVSSTSDDIDLERFQINLLTSTLTLSENEPFDILCESLKIAIDAKHHDRMTSAVVAGVDTPTFNFCRDHERIETRIKTLVTKWLTSSPTSALSSGPHCELRVLALVVALGTRIQLFKTASYHGSRSRFLSTISSECREEGVSSAVDISDLLSFAEVRRPDKTTIYREASFYLMPPLRLAADVLASALQAPGQEGARRISHRHLEIREALKMIVQVMDACKNEAGTYNEFVSKCRTCLETSEAEVTPLRTSFSASSSLGKN